VLSNGDLQIILFQTVFLSSLVYLYCKHHSTETALQYTHDHLINAIGSHKLPCLCLFDLSAAFDTIDHNILITRLSSWFGIHGSVLNWFKSYLTSRSFRVKCDNDFSSEHGPLHLVTIPLSTLIFTLSLNHHLYADDSTFFSFHPRNCDSSIVHLQTALSALQQISS